MLCPGNDELPAGIVKQALGEELAAEACMQMPASLRQEKFGTFAPHP